MAMPPVEWPASRTGSRPGAVAAMTALRSWASRGDGELGSAAGGVAVSAAAPFAAFARCGTAGFRVRAGGSSSQAPSETTSEEVRTVSP